MRRPQGAENSWTSGAENHEILEEIWENQKIWGHPILRFYDVLILIIMFVFDSETLFKGSDKQIL